MEMISKLESSQKLHQQFIIYEFCQRLVIIFAWKILGIKKLLFQAKFEDCQSDPPHSIEDGRLTFIFDEIKAGKEKIISAVLKNCP